MTVAAPPLAPDLAAGLRRLKPAAIHQLAPELLVTARTQRGAPEKALRTLVEAEITAREAANAATRLKTAALPVTKALEEFDRSASSIPTPTLDHIAPLEWITAQENLCLVAPAGTGKATRWSVEILLGYLYAYSAQHSSLVPITCGAPRLWMWHRSCTGWERGSRSTIRLGRIARGEPARNSATP